MLIVGIDPGKNGAMVSIDDHGKVNKTVIPLIGKQLDILTLTNIFRQWPKECPEVRLFIEDVHAIHGSAAGSTFSFGFVCGAIQTAAAAMQIPYILVNPKVWQAVVYHGIPEIRKPSTSITYGPRKGQIQKGKIDTKKMSLLAARRLFPEVDLRKSDTCKVPHDGIVDALLIAEYGRRVLR